ncbi:gap junction delta-4 protein [Amblyraja radiata]|uniref:gap junction delta-4 protein n=1 Tax=Amblyraja radiata TaxID=386614 RepID=UPI0014037F74|nr:gap junction delta-4 protein [Amblyraja radiata]
MGRLDNLGLVTLALRHNLTIVGKLWIAVIVFLRLLVVLGIGYPLYQDEQTKFTCDSMQPGCSNVCYDAFSPISHCRFWFVQAVVLCLPLVIFITYVTHRLPPQNVGCPCQHPQNPAEPPPFRKVPSARAPSMLKVGETNPDLEEFCGEILVINEDLGTGRRVHNFCEAYVLQLLLRALLEAGFGAGQYYLFGFMVPKKFVCSRYPCANIVTCYPSRPTEKTLLANFMFGVTALSFLLNFADLIHVIKQAVKQGKRRKMLMRNFYQEEPYPDMPSDPHVLPEHKALQDYGLQARQRRESGGSAGGGSVSKPGQERAALKQPGEGVLDHMALSNTNSNNAHLNVLASNQALAGRMAGECGGKCAGDQGLAARSSAERCGEEVPDQQGSRLRQHALQSKSSGSPASSDSRQMIEEYRLVHMRITDNVESRKKKSEWV